MPGTKGKKIKLCQRADKGNEPMKGLALPKPPEPTCVHEQDVAFPNNHLQIHSPTTLPRDGGTEPESLHPHPRGIRGVPNPPRLSWAASSSPAQLEEERPPSCWVNGQPRGSLVQQAAPQRQP